MRLARMQAGRLRYIGSSGLNLAVKVHKETKSVFFHQTSRRSYDEKAGGRGSEGEVHVSQLVCSSRLGPEQIHTSRRGLLCICQSHLDGLFFSQWRFHSLLFTTL